MSKATGNINIDENKNEDAVLVNPTLEVISIHVECLFTDEKGKQHSRLKEIDADVNSKLIKDSVKKHKLLKEFK